MEKASASFKIVVLGEGKYPPFTFPIQNTTFINSRGN
jgi:hypothetical protein